MGTLIEKIIYWLATLIIFWLMGVAIIGYTTNHDVMAGFFKKFGYPRYIVYPLAFLKLTAFIIILLNRWRNLKDIAYGAYFINMIAATAAHVLAGDTPVHAYAGLIAIPFSYALSNRVRGEPKHDAFLLPSHKW